MSKALEQILTVVLQEIDTTKAIEVISQSELPMNQLVEKMAVTATMTDTRKSFTAITEFICKSEILNELSQDMDIGEYLGDWDTDDLIEYVCERYTEQTANHILCGHLDCLICCIKYNDEAEQLVLEEIGTSAKPTIRLHVDGSATIKEIKIPSDNVIKE